MSLENAFIEQLAQYIEINYKEYLPVSDHYFCRKRNGCSCFFII